MRTTDSPFLMMPARFRNASVGDVARKTVSHDGKTGNSTTKETTYEPFAPVL